jgi:FR47-like protein
VVDQIRPEDSAALDNPVWSALDGPHRNLAGRLSNLAWYPPSIAPFAAIPAADIVPDLEAARAQGLADSVYLVGVCPKSLPPGWHVVSNSNVLQLLPAGESLRTDEEAGIILGEDDRAGMRELTRIAFPDFFRERTAELGLYLGIYEGGTLIAMAGERMALAGRQEISGVCTHPGFAGRGHARRLYESMGFVTRASLAMCKVERAAEQC